MHQILLVLLGTVLCLASAGDFNRGSPKAVGPCILDRCPRGFRCSEAECVPDPTQIEEIGPCVNTLCPETYQCNDNVCIRPIPRIRAGSDPIGPCVNEKCPDKHLCVANENKCFPMD
ncbi:unnamed protein product [Heligmosomoides polygyrus]|uniref:TIL domain-containing protein n=1 Tax=Heligmosomoides polygyrus TaxID=6339 RepID=A0A183G5V3_HELPZ|nr:unnamed protein product [Heligmosomoides polygyrus]